MDLNQWQAVDFRDKLTGRDTMIKRYHSIGIKHREQSGWIYKEQTDINICIENK